MTKVLCNFNSACSENLQMFTSGMVGVQITFEFSAEWDGLTKTAVFRAGDTQRDVLLTEDTVTIPWEVLAVPRKVLVVGVYGMRGADLVIPTIYAPLGRIQQGADPSGDPSIPPTPSVLERAIESTVTAAELAAAAAAGSAAEAESASDDAEKAQRAAETAKDEAESAKSGAESAKTKAEEAKLGAEAACDRAKTAAVKQPYPNAETGTWWVWDAESGAYSDSGEKYKGLKGDTGPAGSDANVTAENIRSALGYTPADEGDIGDLSALETADKGSLVAAINEALSNIPDGVVQYIAQTLTSDQKAQARSNIGAMGEYDGFSVRTLSPSQDNIVDLNNVTGRGYYSCISGAFADYMRNIPDGLFGELAGGSSGFCLLVFNSFTAVTQILIDWNRKKDGEYSSAPDYKGIFIRSYGDTWSEWVQIYPVTVSNVQRTAFAEDVQTSLAKADCALSNGSGMASWSGNILQISGNEDDPNVPNDYGELFLGSSGIGVQFSPSYRNQEGAEGLQLKLDGYFLVGGRDCFLTGIKEGIDPNDAVNKAQLDEKITAPATASIGQVICVKAVDEAGRPTEWEAANPYQLYRHYVEFTSETWDCTGFTAELLLTDDTPIKSLSDFIASVGLHRNITVIPHDFLMDINGEWNDTLEHFGAPNGEVQILPFALSTTSGTFATVKCHKYIYDYDEQTYILEYKYCGYFDFRINSTYPGDLQITDQVTPV